MRQQRHRDGRVRVADDGVGQLGRIHLAPAHGLARRRAGKAAGVRPRVGDLDEKVLAEFLDAQNFLDLRLGLEREILRAAAAPEHHAAAPARALGGEDDAGGFVHVNGRVHAELAAAQFHARHVHADGRVARRTGVARHARAIRRRHHGNVLQTVLALPFSGVFADEMVQFGGAHFLLKFRQHEHFAQQFVRGHQAVGIRNHHVVNADEVVVAQVGVVELEAAAVDRIIQREVQVVVKIRAGGNDPVHESRLDERDDAGAAEAGGRERTGNAHADGHVRRKHPFGEKLARFLEPRGIVGEEHLVNDVGQLFLAGEVFRVDALARHVFLFMRTAFFLHPLGHFGNGFAIVNFVTFGSCHRFC